MNLEKQLIFSMFRTDHRNILTGFCELPFIHRMESLGTDFMAYGLHILLTAHLFRGSNIFEMSCNCAKFNSEFRWRKLTNQLFTVNN